MKKLFIGLMIAVSALSVAVSEAQAKRMGGGGSFGRQSQSVSRQAHAPAQNQSAVAPKPAAPASAQPGVPPKPSSPWKSMLGGALLGLGLGALLSHFGLGGALGGMLGSVLMIALLAMAGLFIYRMLRRKSSDAGAMRSAYAGGPTAGYTPEIGSRIEPTQRAAPHADEQVTGAGAAHNPASAAPWGVPADFDAAAFLRQSKTYFIRLQAVWDKADINDLREFTSPELFAELRLQLQERGASANHTDVVTLDAELLGIETINNEYLASVKFTGMIKESEQAPAEAFAEVWNLSKSISGQGGWVLAGIQQLS
ncbi:Tim44 domain-containing protein [Noviherbaspirillum autotrophicum]|uniref:Membrane protein n=1 Tax=Noviherbaspirillum autotrophicum TaxID=709839 RepID=A0A0C2BZ04_9BURK|nr:Tim44-like domain-containing protein [Noviherbaspirillum autotrophicum]KIF83246.1 membrane protein [Noviherbaspirillum autotrophicum]